MNVMKFFGIRWTVPDSDYPCEIQTYFVHHHEHITRDVDLDHYESLWCMHIRRQLCFLYHTNILLTIMVTSVNRRRKRYWCYS